MMNTESVTNISKMKKLPYLSPVLVAGVFFYLLLMRDAYSTDINKYVLLAIVGLCAVFMRIDNLIYLFCFLFPLYVGLPGNYLTLVLLVRLLLGVRQLRVSSFLLSIAVALYMLIQNTVMGYSGIVPLMLPVGMIVILLLFSYAQKLNPFPMIWMYAAGVAALGFIMLSATLQVYEIDDLMSTSFRLGSSSVDYAEKGIMNVSVDPNFYGMFAIASISTAFPLIFQSKTNLLVKVTLIIFAVTQMVVCLIGLSRAFIIVFVVWVLLYLLFQRNFKGTVIAMIAIVVIVALLINFMPEIIETALARFEDSDMATGNRRLTLMQEFWDEWSSDAIATIFGVGLYNCNVHCTPLQFLFGGGLALFILMTALLFSYKVPKLTKRRLVEFVPFIVTFAMMCTVPAATLLNFVFPLVLIGLSMHNMEKSN